MFDDATNEEVDLAIAASWNAFLSYRDYSLKQRAAFMRAIAQELENTGDELLQVANEETHLPLARLTGEKARTVFQLRSYADACERGDWLEIRIDTLDAVRNPPKPDLRKTLIPVGPVAVFGAANFPFAYSTAGGDTACAFAAGCPVIVKAHPGHAKTSQLVAEAIERAAQNLNMPAGIFAHLHGKSNEVGERLVKHPLVKSVGFTGSLAGGRQLFDWANQRKEPIPVFAEMSSINPVFILPGKMKQSAAEVAKMCAGSITLGVGQFCTNPGLLVAIDGPELDEFVELLSAEIKAAPPGEMLHTGIFKNYVERRANALAQPSVETIAAASAEPVFNQASPTIASATAEAFMNNPVLHQEVFGPYSIIIRCSSSEQMIDVARHIEGQLTASVIGTQAEITDVHQLVTILKNLCGRLIFNGMPTGVEVCLSMQHGGPYPSTTDSRFTSVGADGIRRFARPVAFQNWPDELLPDELKNANPLGLWRTVNDQLQRDPVA